jgi:catechol 2,3-dioxygenase-like lactoylglutathione lyase family enzyme
MQPFELISINHLNAIVDGYDGTVEHLCSVFGAQVNLPIPGNPDNPDDTDACLITVGDVIFELFAPRRRGERGQGRLLERFGDHYVGVEYRVPDVAVARERCAGLDVRIINDVGRFFYTYPGSCLGISWELWDGDWREHLGGAGRGPLHPRAFWREQPLGLDGLDRISVAVRDLEPAIERLSAVTGASVLERTGHPQAAALGASFQLGNTMFELLAPTGDGPVSAHLDRYGEGIRSTVFKVLELGRLEKHLAEKGIDLVPGDRENTLAVRAEQNHNLLFEFAE